MEGKMGGRYIRKIGGMKGRRKEKERDGRWEDGRTRGKERYKVWKDWWKGEIHSVLMLHKCRKLKI